MMAQGEACTGLYFFRIIDWRLDMRYADAPSEFAVFCVAALVFM